MNKIRQIFENEFWSKLIKNVVTVLTGTGGASMITLLTTLVLTRALGTTQYGILVLVQQYMTVLDGIVNFQSWQGVVKYGSEAVVKKDNEMLASIIKKGFWIDIATAVLGAIVAVIGLPVIKNLFHWDEQRIFLAMLFSIEIIFHIEGTSTGVLRLLNKFKLTAINSIVMAGIKFVILGGYFLTGGKSLTITVILFVVTDIIKHLSLVAIALIVLSKQIGLRQILTAQNRGIGNRFLKYTLWSNISSSADIPVKYFDVFIIEQISVEMVAIYKVFKQIISILSRLTGPISLAILPQLSELVAKGGLREGYNKVLKLQKTLLRVGLLGMVGVVFLVQPILNLFFGAEYANEWVLFLVLLAVTGYALSYVAIHPYFAALGKVKEDFFITLLSNILYLVVATVLVKELGVYAILIGTLIQSMTVIFIKRHIIQTVLIYENEL